MKSTLPVLALTLAFALAAPAQAANEVLYVTDRLLAELHTGPDPDSPVLLRLPTGTPLTLKETRNGYALVALDGDRQGWVAVQYLSEQEPALATLLKLDDERQRQQQELQQLRNQAADRHVPIWLVGAAGSLALVLGFLMGVAWLDHRMRERHGGFRI